MTDFSKPQRMSGCAFIIIFSKMLNWLGSLIFIYIVMTVYDADFSTSLTPVLLKVAALFGGWIGIALLLSFAAYFSRKFHVHDGNLIYTYGLLRRDTTTIPLDRIHSLRTKRGLIYRLLGMRGITVDTLASKGAELELILNESDWQDLLGLIEKEESAPPVESEGGEQISGARHEPGVRIRMDNQDLFLDALCQNHLKGMAVLLGFLGVIFNQINDITGNAAITILDYTSSHFDESMVTTWHIFELLAAVYIVVMVLWLGKALLRYYNMTLTIDDNLLTSESGLFSHSTIRCSLEKICTVWVKRNYLERKAGLSTMMLRQAHNATAAKEEDNLKIYGKDYSDVILGWWLGEDYLHSPEILTAKSGRGLLAHRIWLPLAVAAAATVIMCHFRLYVWTLIPIIYFLVVVANAVCAMRRSSITLREAYLVVFNGRFADIRNYIKYEDIQVVQIRRTPFSSFFHRVALTLSTSGTTFTVRSLKEEEATLIFEYLLLRTEQLSPLSVCEASL